MGIKTVDLRITQLLEDLASGMAWTKKEDLGMGSIQEKYGATEMQVATIRKHPALKDAQPSLVVFNLIDDSEPLSTTAGGGKLDTKEQPKTENKEAVVSDFNLADSMNSFANL